MKQCEVGKLTKRSDVVGKKISARWDHIYKWDANLGCRVAKSRYVAREFKWQEYRDDLFTPGSSMAESRVVDYVALKHAWPTFTVDAEDAYYHVPEEEDVWVECPPEILEERHAEGDYEDYVWQLKKQLPGRRAGGKHWVEFAAESLKFRGFERSPTAPQFFWHAELPCLVELHMDDMYGTAPGLVGSEFVLDLGRDIKVKWSGLLDEGSD